jgi:hypothetical protein
VQAAWIYLEPVFGAEDISKQMPAEGNMFKSVDSRWRDLMSKVNLNPRVANVTNIPHILGILQVNSSHHRFLIVNAHPCHCLLYRCVRLIWIPSKRN